MTNLENFGVLIDVVVGEKRAWKFHTHTHFFGEKTSAAFVAKTNTGIYLVLKQEYIVSISPVGKTQTFFKTHNKPQAKNPFKTTI